MEVELELLKNILTRLATILDISKVQSNFSLQQNIQFRPCRFEGGVSSYFLFESRD